MSDNTFRGELGQQLRVDSIRVSTQAGSGHPTSSMSAADLMAVLLDGHLRLDFDQPRSPHNDHLVFSKGHASPLYYSVLKAAGAIDDDELLTYRQSGSRLEGHPTPRIPPTDVATGSLGQGLPIGVGIALAGKRLDRLPYRVWVLCGDSEMAEGSMWEAFEHAAHHGLDNLTAIIDVNRLGQTTETMLGWDLDTYAARARAFGWHAITLDGHDLDAIEAAYTEAESTRGSPTVLIAKTRKGKGVKAVEDQPGKHGKPLDDPDDAIAELGGVRDLSVRVRKPDTAAPVPTLAPEETRMPSWDVGDEVATRRAYGEALTALGTLHPDVVALDGEVSNSTSSELFAKAHSDRYFEMYIAEQQMIAAAVGLQARGWKPFASTFAAFLSRAYDFIRMAAISRADLRLCGSHAGVSIGADGPSQMALEDIAAFRAVHGSVVLHPSDANQTTRLLTELAGRDGISYLRTLRGKTTVRTGKDEDVRIGGSRIVRYSDNDQVTLVGCGITVGEAEEAATRLAADGVTARVLDCYSIKPIDSAALQTAARDTGVLITIEDHWPEGGLGDAVLEALAEVPDVVRVRKLAVREMPASGSPDELLAAAGIDADHIVAATQDIVGRRVRREHHFGEISQEEREIIRGEQGTSSGDPHDDTDPQSG
ncbi:transketolase [Amycolatopsis sp. NPDC058340]|uniref:transketolase n=1 Tax=Amycolatopsis sp. NPDC058340 TaxID=3346453 RepID=UPI00366350FB